jgi:hypothetical protein
MGCVKSGGVTVDNLDFEEEKLWIRRQVFGRSPLDPSNGAGRTRFRLKAGVDRGLFRNLKFWDISTIGFHS